MLPAFGAQAEAPPSIHQQDLLHWHGKELEGLQPWRDPQNIAVEPLGSQTRSSAYQIHGYHPYWAGSTYTGYDWSLISTVAFFGLELGPDGSITDDHGWPWTGLVSMAHDQGTRVIITVTNFSASELSTLLANPEFRIAAITNILAAVQQGGADGVNVDFENLPLGQRETFVLFVKELAEGLDKILEFPYLSVATPAVDWAGSYRYAELASHCDHLMIMGYNYHYSGSANTGPVAPLAAWGTYNVSWTVEDYLFWGVSPSSILLGVPYFGYRWPSESSEPGASTTARGTAVTFATACPEGQIHGLIWDNSGQTNWYRYESDPWSQVWFENQASLGFKYEYVKDQSLAGIGIWALSYDGSRPELWSALSEAFSENSAAHENISQKSTYLIVHPPTPNPASSKIHFNYWLSQPSSLTITVYDLKGHKVAPLFSGIHPPGTATTTWTPKNHPSGTYLIHYTTPKATATQKITLTN